MTKRGFDLNQGIQGKYSKLKVFWHKRKMDSFLEETVTAPIYVRVKPTNKCNHRCFYCVYEPDFSNMHETMDRRDEIPREKMLEILEDFRDMGVRAVTYSGGGEPLIYPHITEILRRTLDNKIDLSMITNGQELRGENAEILSQANWVRVSIDYCDEETFSKNRRRKSGDFRIIEENARTFARIKRKDCDFEVNFVVHENNYDRIYEATRFLKGLGFENVRFGPLWMPNFLEYHRPFKDIAIEQISRAKQDFSDENFEVGDSYTRDFEMSGVSERGYERCYWMQVCPAIGADQIVYMCHNKAYDKTGIIGSIKDKSFRELWYSPETRRLFRSFNPKTSCRHQCTNDEKNHIIIEALACADPRVVNFP